jgi:hypothetical protein
MSFVLCVSSKTFFSHDQIKKDEMEGACGAHAAEINVGKPYRRHGIYDLCVGT